MVDIEITNTKKIVGAGGFTVGIIILLAISGLPGEYGIRIEGKDGEIFAKFNSTVLMNITKDGNISEQLRDIYYYDFVISHNITVPLNFSQEHVWGVFHGNATPDRIQINRRDGNFTDLTDSETIIPDENITARLWFNAQHGSNGKFDITGCIIPGDSDTCFTLDPYWEYTFVQEDSVSWQLNRTEISNHGARLDAPVLFMDFNNPPENPLTGYTNVGDGTYVQDNSVNNNYGTMSGMNGSYWVDGVSGNAIEMVSTMTDTGDYVDLVPMYMNESFTMSFWANPSTSTSYKVLASNYGRETSSKGWSIYPLSSNRWFFSSTDNNGVADGVYSTNDALKVDQWQHILITKRTDGTFDMYVDGVNVSGARQGDGNLIDMQVTNTISLGLDEQNNWDFGGIIDEVSFYNCSMNATEIALMNSTPGYVGQCEPGETGSLISYYALNETSGTTATDSAGSNTGTLTNYPSDSTGTTPIYNSSCGTTGSGFDLGGCYEFDGVDDYVEISADESVFDFEGTDEDFSVSAWIKRADTVSASIISSEDASNDGWRMSLNTYDKLYCSVDLTDSYSNGDLDDNNWHFVTCVWNRDGNIETYIDGIKNTDVESSIVGNSMSTTHKITIGKEAYGSTYPFAGSIDQVQIFDRALSADEVLNLYNGTSNNSNYIGKYASDGDFKSLVFYNETSTYWNTTFSIADSTGGYEVNLSDPNLVSYWELNENFKDTMGLNNGTPSGDIVNATGISSGAMRFDGAGDKIEISGAKDILEDTTASGMYTVSAWINPNSITGSHPIVAARRNDNFFFAQVDDGLKLMFNDEYIYESGVFETNNWYHVVGTEVQDGANFNATLYINGKFIGSDSLTRTGIGNVNLWIGYEDRFGETFNGTIDEVLIYDKALTASEVQELYKAGLTQHANANVTLQTRTATSYNVSDAGLVGLWGLNGDANDELGVNNGTEVNQVTYNESYGIVGKGADFAGSDDYISINESWDDGITGNISVSLWFKTDVLGTYNYLLSNRNSDDGISVIHRQAGQLQILGGDMDVSLLSNTIVGLDSWHHFVGVVDVNNEAYVYMDGNLDNTQSGISGNYGISSNNLYIGARPDTASYEHNGKIDEVRIYNRSLSAAEIQNLYELGSYHIEWTGGEDNWTSWGVMSDLVPARSNVSSNFFQYRTEFNTNDTDVSSYILNSSVSYGNQPGSPSANISLGDGISSLEWRVPFHTGTTAYNVEPTGQTDSIGIFQAYNNGTLAGDLVIKHNDTYANVITWCSNSSNFAQYVIVNTTYQILEVDVAPNNAEQVKVWCQRNYTAIPTKKDIEWDLDFI